MHPSVLAQRRARAMDRIVQAARHLDPEHTESLQPKGIKDPQAAEMMRLEAIADLLERLAVTVVTAEANTDIDPASISTFHSVVPGEGLPAPRLETEPSAENQPETPSKKSAGRKAKK